MRIALLLAAVLLAAGCLAAGPEVPPPTDSSTGTIVLGSGLTFHAYGNAGNLSILHLAEGPSAQVAFPPGVLVMNEEKRLLPAGESVELAGDQMVWFLPPYGATNLTVDVTAEGGTEELTIPLTSDAGALFPGEKMIELLKIQRDQFPHRSPGMPSHDAAMDYFAEFFSGLGYDTVVDKYNSPSLEPVTDVQGGSFSTVVAYKRGTLSPERYLIFGGHFDVVEQTRDGAFDNTAGTVATMVMAQALANVSTEHTIVFGLWGGEEDGILGSQGWLSRNPSLVPFIDGYFNYDVTGIAWPAPKVDPAPIVVAAGPDGPVAEALHGYATEIETVWMNTDAEWIHEGVGQGQATGAGVNAQSDHTPFMSRGIPVYFPFTARVNDVFSIIHSEVDTVDNLTRYAYCGIDCMLDTSAPLEAEEHAEGEWYLARSFETQLALGFYWVVLTDAGHFPVPARETTAAAPAILG